LIDIQITFLIPFSLSFCDAFINPGKCFWEQVGVKAPGRPKRIVFFPAIISFIETSLVFVSYMKTFASRNLSPILTVSTFIYI